MDGRAERGKKLSLYASLVENRDVHLAGKSPFKIAQCSAPENESQVRFRKSIDFAWFNLPRISHELGMHTFVIVR